MFPFDDVIMYCYHVPNIYDYIARYFLYLKQHSLPPYRGHCGLVMPDGDKDLGLLSDGT